MSETDRLPPDQRAVLSLVLERGKSYAEVAAMLSIPEAVVRERAHTALDSLAGAGVRDAVAGSHRSASEAAPAEEPPPPPSPPRSPAWSAPASAGASRLAPSSRTGGIVLLAGIVAVVVVAVVLLTSGGGGGNSSGNARSGATSTTATGATGSTSTNGAHIDAKLTLSPVEPESHAGGEAYVLSDGSRRAFYVAAHGLPPSSGFFYAVWLYNSPSSSAPLGRAPTVGSNGRLEGGGPLPSNAADYARLIVTRETNTHARHPGTIVLGGAFSLH